ncbi:putative F-box domain-containing protein [Tanacetum coccineum]
MDLDINMSCHIPFEIQEEIMKRLPIKSLIRFKSVSKPWMSLIHSTKFIVQYKLRQHLLLVKYDDLGDNEAKYVSFVDDDTFPKDKFSYTVPMSVKLLDKPCIIGCSKGLLCLYSKKTDTAVLWNPAIRKSVTINMPDVLVRYPHGYQTVIGFGVLPNTCDPKLVQITYSWDMLGQIGRRFEFFTLSIFTLSTRAWRSINLPRKSIVLLDDHIDINGFIYWHANHRDENNMDKSYHVIMSFDMTSEEFTQINLPRSLPLGGNVIMSITKLMESLVVCEYIYGGTYYDVWMMENGTSNSFKKIFTIEMLDAKISRGFGFRKNGEIIGKRINRVDTLFVYDPYLKLKKEIGVYGKTYSLYVNSYMETLLLLDQ